MIRYRLGCNEQLHHSWLENCSNEITYSSYEIWNEQQQKVHAICNKYYKKDLVGDGNVNKSKASHKHMDTEKNCVFVYAKQSYNECNVIKCNTWWEWECGNHPSISLSPFLPTNEQHRQQRIRLYCISDCHFWTLQKWKCKLIHSYVKQSESETWSWVCTSLKSSAIFVSIFLLDRIFFQQWYAYVVWCTVYARLTDSLLYRSCLCVCVSECARVSICTYLCTLAHWISYSSGVCSLCTQFIDSHRYFAGIFVLR